MCKLLALLATEMLNSGRGALEMGFCEEEEKSYNKNFPLSVLSTISGEANAKTNYIMQHEPSSPDNNPEFAVAKTPICTKAVQIKFCSLYGADAD